MVIFALTLLSYIINKIPMWVTALLSLSALYITGCVDANGALGGFANVNTILMGACFMVASGFRRTSLVKLMCDWLLKLTNGSFMKVYFGYLLLGVLLTNFMNSPMVVYAIIGPLLCALCDRTGYSRSKYIFPLMVIVHFRFRLRSRKRESLTDISRHISSPGWNLPRSAFSSRDSR